MKNSKSPRSSYGPLGLLLLVLHAACVDTGPTRPSSGGEVPITSWPLPTENWLDDDAETTQKQRRKAWFREIHRAAPGVDWKAIEQRNGLAQIDKRNAIARSAESLQFASPWVERGSQNQAGRMHVAVYGPDGSTIYGGSSKGGVWKRTDSNGWEPIGDNLYGGAHWLAVIGGATAEDPPIVLAAQDGGTVRVSIDDGASWVAPSGLPSLNNVRRVLTTSDGSDTVFVVGRSSGQFRVWRSNDGLASFTSVRSLGSFAGDAWTPRTGSPDLYVVDGSDVLKSVDFGDTWSTVGTTPSGTSGAELCGSEAGAPRLWGVFTRNGAEELHRSDDEGTTWIYQRDLDDYWGSLNASIVDASLFAYGGVEVWRTTNGGGAFAKINGWAEYYGNPTKKLHADIPGIDVWPGGPAGETWFVSTDGGLYQSKTQLNAVDSLSVKGLRVSQYYSTHTSTANPLNVVAGAQDQGYQFANEDSPAVHTRLDFDQLISGDYGHIVSGNGTHDFVFSTYPGFILAHVGESNPSLYQISFPANENNAWLPPVVGDNINLKNFFFCATRLWRYKRQIGTNVWDEELWSTYDFEGSSGEYLSAFAISPVNISRAYAATNRGRLFHSDDRGVTWTESMSTGPNAHYFYGTALLPSSLDKDVVWVGGSGYSGPAVYRSTDGGLTFQGFSAGLPNTLVYCLGEAPDGSGRLFCGTETAAYMLVPGEGQMWVDVTSNEAPVTTYWSVEALPHENTMRFGTYGRGIWDYQIDPQGRTLIQNGSGSNTVCLSSPSGPELGGSWEVEVDATGHAGATFTGFLIHVDSSSGTFLKGGELLIDRTSPFLFQLLAPSSGGVDAFSFAVVNDPSLAGLISYAQGFVLGGAGWELCNRLEVVLGY